MEWYYTVGEVQKALEKSEDLSRGRRKVWCYIQESYLIICSCSSFPGCLLIHTLRPSSLLSFLSSSIQNVICNGSRLHHGWSQNEFTIVVFHHRHVTDEKLIEDLKLKDKDESKGKACCPSRAFERRSLHLDWLTSSSMRPSRRSLAQSSRVSPTPYVTWNNILIEISAPVTHHCKSCPSQLSRLLYLRKTGLCTFSVQAFEMNDIRTLHGSRIIISLPQLIEEKKRRGTTTR